MTSTDADEWELKKENIQPIKQGRKVSTLNSVLGTRLDEINFKRQIFENELRTYSGDDPLDIWFSYINWVEQNFPKGGKEGNIAELIEKCITIYHKETKYKNDPRFVEVCLKYANMSGNSLEVYNYLYTQNIGTSLANLYKSWSWELERLGNMKRADEVLLEGIYRKAEPEGVLQTTHKQFQIRLQKAIADNMDEPIEEQPAIGRTHLAPLKAHPKKHTVSVNRVGLKPIEQVRGLPSSKEINTQSKTSFKVFSDENTGSTLPLKTPTSKPTLGFVPDSSATKENQMKPDKWTKVKVKQKGVGNVPFDDLGSYVKSSFQVHIEDDISQPSVTPRKLAENTSTALSTKKVDFKPAIALFEPPDSTKRPMYNKFKVYGGAEEFQFEEIRAAKWFKNYVKLEEERKKEEEERRKEEQTKLMAQKLELLQQEIQILRQHVAVQDTRNCNDDKRNEPSEISQSSEQQFKAFVDPQPVSDMSKEHFLPDSRDLSSLQFTQQKTENICEHSEYPELLPPPIRKNQISSPLNQATDEDLCYQSENSERVNVPKLMVTNVENDIICTEFAYQELEKKENYNLPLKHNELDNTSFEPPFASTGRYDIEAYKNGEMSSNALSVSTPSHKVFNSESNRDTGSFQHITSHPSTPTVGIKEAMSMVRELYCDDVRGSLEKENSALPKDLEQSFNSMSFRNDQPSNINNHQPLIIYQDDEQDENKPPPDYNQVIEKRELAGILTPSLNVYYIPLEQQKEEESDDDLQCEVLPDDSDNDNVVMVKGNVTLISACNEEEFAANAKLISTPFFRPLQEGVPMNDVSHAAYEKLDATHSMNKVYSENQSDIRLKATPDPVAFAIPQASNLSPILEGSHEYYSKSSGSSGSCCTGLAMSCHHPASVLLPSHKKITSNTMNSCSSMQLEREKASESQFYPSSAGLCTDQMEIISNTAASLDIDPFDPLLIQQFLSKLKPFIYKNPNFIQVDQALSYHLKELSLDNTNIHILDCFAEGSYAKVFRGLASGNNLQQDSFIAIKSCISGNEWEYYICCELQDRLAQLNKVPDIRSSVMKINHAVSFNNGIILISDFAEFGTLVNVMNVYKKHDQAMPECLVMHFALEMLQIVSQVHFCNIIHSDVKPDNFLLLNVPQKEFIKCFKTKTNCLCLIDFGRSIDMSLLPPETTFNLSVKTSSFECTEMRDGKPWTFQTDWFGVLGSIHVMLFSQYMNITKNCSGRWQITNKFKRYWQVDIWQPLFDTLLNIPSCHEIPDMTPFAQKLIDKLQEPSISRNVMMKAAQLYNLLQGH